MEAIAVTAAESSTGSHTMADLASLAAEKHGARTALSRKRDGSWHDVTFAAVGEIVRDLALGLVTVGVQPGERVAILCTTRPEWTYFDFAIASAGAVVVPIYPTNSPEECEWVLGDSGAVAVVCEDSAQASKIAAVAQRLPDLRLAILVEPADPADRGFGDRPAAITLEQLRERGRAGDPSEVARRIAGVRREDPFTIIYTSGTTGPPKGCVLTHGNYRDVLDMTEATGLVQEDELVYLFLPLAHAYALLIQLVSFDVGSTIAYFGGDTTQVVAELPEVKPTYLPSVPRIFEKIYTAATDMIANASPEERERFERAIELGVEVRQMQTRGEAVPEELQAAFQDADERLYRNVRAIFGGRLRQAVSGAAPIAPEILRFFYASGVPVLEGYGMTETSTVATYSTLEHFRFGTVGRTLPGVEARIAPDGELLLRGGNIFSAYHGNETATRETVDPDRWLHTGDLGEIDDDGYVKITGRKKDIIITAGGKNITPANLENDLKQSRFISQAVMHGDRRPYPVALIALDEEEIAKWATERDLPTDIASLARSADVRALIQSDLDRVNARYAQVERIKRFAILDHDLSQETGELTPTLKVKRNVVEAKYADLIAGLY